MKKYIAILFFAAIAATAQAQTDTSYIRQVGGLFYTVTRTDFADGGYTESQRLVGDSIGLYNQYRNSIEQQGKDMAVEVGFISGYSRRLTGLPRDGARIRTLTGRDPVDSLRLDSLTRAHFTNQTWAIRGDTSQTISFNFTAAGVLRYRINNGANRNAQVIGTSILRLTGYPAQNRNTDFYLVNRRYIRADNRLRIMTTGNR
jgi:hypothetical protein